MNARKRNGLVTLSLLLLVGSFADGQAAQLPSWGDKTGTAKLLQDGFAVPDAPALKMLDADASKLLRPTSVKALTAGLSNATGDFSFIPRAFSVEFSPLLLVQGDRLSLQQYQASPTKYRTRISIASKRDTGSVARTQVAAAIRIGIDDASDFRTNNRVLNTLNALTRFEVEIDSIAGQRARALRIPSVDLNAEEQRRRDSVVTAVTEEHAIRSKALIEAAKKAQEDALWNANVFDVAIGVRGSAADSTGAGMQYDGVAGWFTLGRALARGWQVLFGARAAYERDFTDATTTDLKASSDIALRTYAGSNRYKALGELQLTTRADNDAKWLGRLGGELALSDALWIEASLGYQSEGSLSKGKVVSSFKFKFTPPGT